jgi:lipopolysaccharide biosynthesis glycosyltransferase
MFYVWLTQVKKHSADAEIVVLSKEPPNDYIKLLIEGDKSVTWKICNNGNFDTSKFRQHQNHHNLNFKLPNLSKETEPFIFIDVDAFVIKDLNEIWKYKDDQHLIGINHQIIPNHTENEPEPFLNSGVLIVGDPKILNLDDIIDKFPGFLCKGVDQAILFSYFKVIGYDYTHKDVGHGWNACAGHSRLWKENDDWFGETINLKNKHDVYINHYWDVYKPWNIKCPLYLETWK